LKRSAHSATLRQSSRRFCDGSGCCWRRTGYQPQLDQDAQTGEALPHDSLTLGFSAAAGGVVADTSGGSGEGAGDRWRVRRETIDALRQLVNGKPGGDGNSGGDLDAVRRANRLLAAYVREILAANPQPCDGRLPT
jgi:hypothetical protein